MATLQNCERCGLPMEVVFVLANAPFYVLPGERVRQSIHTGGDDLFANPWWRQYLPSKAQYALGHHCRSCKYLTLDYGKKYSQTEAREILEDG
jgi:hypothetical protein